MSNISDCRDCITLAILLIGLIIGGLLIRAFGLAFAMPRHVQQHGAPLMPAVE